MITIENVAGHSYVPDWFEAQPVIVDLGANKGKFSLAAIAKHNARVYAAEAEPGLYESLAQLRNPALILKHVAISGSNGTMTLNVFADRCASVCGELSEGEQAHTTIVPSETLGRFLSEFGLSRVDLLKMDIEGSELEVLTQISDEALLRINQITVEFHEFLYPEMHNAIEQIKTRFRRLHFYVLDFSLVNGDVLFINPKLRVGVFSRLCLQTAKYKAGLLRRSTSLRSTNPG